MHNYYVNSHFFMITFEWPTEKHSVSIYMSGVSNWASLIYFVNATNPVHF